MGSFQWCHFYNNCAKQMNCSFRIINSVIGNDRQAHELSKRKKNTLTQK